ncbi:hypothetical protein [Emticicia sp.]|uniref:hypothetical protein n=1 Tax=Emticicia sp. TaxID=1930953 RepID=UPI003752D714
MKKKIFIFYLVLISFSTFGQSAIVNPSDTLKGQEFFMDSYRIKLGYPFDVYSFSDIFNESVKLKDKKFKIIDTWLSNKFGGDWFQLEFASGTKVKVNGQTLDALIGKSDSKKERELFILQEKQKYKNKVFYTGKMFMYNQQIKKLVNGLDSTQFNPTIYSKFTVLDVLTYDQGFIKYELIDTKGQKYFFNDSDFERFIWFAETEEMREKEKVKLSTLQAKYGSKIGRLIFFNDVQIGMTKEMCRLSWGEPKDINRTITKYSTREQWVYNDGYLYFENGKLTTIQN